MASAKAFRQRASRIVSSGVLRRPPPEPALWRFFLGGLAGTAAIMALIYLVDPFVRGQPFDPDMSIRKSFNDPTGTGDLILHLFNGGFILPLGYAFISARLPGSAVMRGLFWGALVWATAQCLVIPILGSGFFGDTRGGLRAVLSALVGYLAYGACQGLVAVNRKASRVSTVGQETGSEVAA